MVNVEQSKNNLIISYWDEHGELKVSKIALKQSDMYNYVHTSPDDRQADRKYTSQEGRPIKRVPSSRLNKYRKIEILNTLPDNIKNKIFALNRPKKTFGDIEVYSKDEFPEETEAKHPIVSNCWCDENGEIWLQGLKPLSELEVETLQRRANAYLNDLEDDSLKKKYKLNYLYYENETAMLDDYISNWAKKFHIIFGWNYLKFDIRYIRNRCKKLGVDYLKLSPTRRTFTWNLSDKHQRDIKHAIELPMHRPVMDYMKVYEEFDRSVKLKTNVNLDSVASTVLKTKKIEFSGSLAELYDEDYMKFYLYAIVDPVLVQLIDQKLKTYETLLTLSNVGKVDHFDGFHASAIANTLFSDYYRTERNQMLVKDYGEINKGSYSGGWVKKPILGLHDDVLIHDFTSFFPSGMMAFNMGVDSLLGKIDSKYINTYLTKKGREHNEIMDQPKFDGLIYYDKYGAKKILDDNCIISANGLIYDKNKNSSLNDLIWKLFSNRVKNKRMAADIDAAINKAKNVGKYEELGKLMVGWGISENIINEDDLEKIISELKSAQINAKNLSDALKVIMNSMYGVIGYAAFILYDKGVAESVTTQSRLVIQHAIKKTNSYFNVGSEFNFWNDIEGQKRMGIHGLINQLEKSESVKFAAHEPVKYADTDSIMTSLSWLYESVGWKKLIEDGKVDIDELKSRCYRMKSVTLEGYKFDKEIYYKILFCIALDEFMLQPMFEEIFVNYCEKYNAHPLMRDGSPSYSLGLEQINKNILWTGKKYYVKNPIWDDGKALMPEEEIQVKGLPINKSSFPKYVRDNLKNIITEIMRQGENMNYSDVVKIVKNVREGFELAGIENVSLAERLNKYHAYCINDKEDIVLMSGCPQNVRAAASYNHVRQKEENHKYYSHYKPIKDGTKIQMFITKDTNLQVFGFLSGEYPMEIAPDIDWDKQFDKVILSPLNLVFEALQVEKLDSNLLSFTPLL